MVTGLRMTANTNNSGKFFPASQLPDMNPTELYQQEIRTSNVSFPGKNTSASGYKIMKTSEARSGINDRKSSLGSESHLQVGPSINLNS